VRLSVNTPIPDQSKAFMPLQETWGIYLNTVEQFSSGLVPTSEYQALRDDLVRRLKSLRDPRTRQLVFDWIALREEVYQGPYMEQAPDVLIASRSFQMDSIIPPKSMLFFRRTTHNGHSPTGIFAVYGPHTRCGEVLSGCRLLDVAPTVLHLMGLPIIEDMDGEVLAKALNPASPPAVRSVEHVAAQWAGTSETFVTPRDEEEVVKKRLRDLGYLD
jgi:predicted AlkP superfamily phosphohydrolase/phosphomutase